MTFTTSRVSLSSIKDFPWENRRHPSDSACLSKRGFIDFKKDSTYLKAKYIECRCLPWCYSFAHLKLN